MQRLAHTEIHNSQAIELLSNFHVIKNILLNHLPPSTVSIFANPEILPDGKKVEWFTDLQGQPQLLGNSKEDQQKRAKIQPHLTNCLNDIQALKQDLMQRGLLNTQQVTLLSQLVEGLNHHTCQTYLVNGQPVLVGWGIGEKPVVAPVVAPQSKNWLWWLLLPLLLLLFGFLLWWFVFRQPEPPVVTVVEPPKVEEPVVTPPPVVEPETTPEIPKAPEKVCTKKIVESELPPQVVVIFNNASGMRYTIKETIQAIDKFDRRLDKERVSQKEVDYMMRKPNRSGASKIAVNNIIDTLNPKIDIGLVELKSCLSRNPKHSAAVSHGIFSADKRASLKKKINKMKVRPHEVAGTPIYEGLEKALKLVDGIERDAYILLITEGNGDCTRRDVCALVDAEKLKRPKLKINIVSVNSPWYATDCLAEYTGGQIFNRNVNSEQDLTDLVNNAMTDLQTVEVCE